MTESRNNRISSDEFLKRAALQESTDGFKTLLDDHQYLDVPERMTEFELVHDYIVQYGTRKPENWNATAFELNGIVAACKNQKKVLAHSVSQDRAKVFAIMNEDGWVCAPKGVDYDFMAEALLDQRRALRETTCAHQAFIAKLEI